MLNGMVWIARSGAPWRDLPERYGPWNSVYSRFRKWIDDGILDNIFRVLSLEAELYELSLDATIVQAHQHSAGCFFYLYGVNLHPLVQGREFLKIAPYLRICF